MENSRFLLDCIEGYRLKENSQIEFSSADSIEPLRKALKANRLTLCLGAGFSLPNGIPNWSDLIRRVAADALSPDLSTRLLELLKSDLGTMSPLIISRFLKASFTVRASLSNSLHSALYSQYKPRNTNHTLDAVLRLVAHCVEKKIALNIIIYNYDSLLEEQLQDRGLMDSIDIVHDEVSMANAECLVRLMHVHGYIPFEKFDIRNGRNVVFAEDEFHSIYANSGKWANHVQLSAFRYTSSLFVGFSMTDPSVRRLLDASTESCATLDHYCVLERRRAEGGLDSERADFLNYFMFSVLRDLGVNITWVDDYSEIPKLIEFLIE